MSVVLNQAKSLYARTPCFPSEAHRQPAGRWSGLTDVCSLLGISGTFSADTCDTAFQHIQLKTGQRLFTIDQNFGTLYIVNSGFLKTVLRDEARNERVLSFPMRGDVLGIDGIHPGKYLSEAVALSDCDIIAMPFQVFTSLGKKYPELEISLCRLMSQELIRSYTMVTILSSLRAEARVARFLTSLSDRFSRLGYSGTEFKLRMTRQEIGSYLGLTLETASRALCALNNIGYIAIDGKSVCIIEPLRLRLMQRLPPLEVCAPKKVMAEMVIGSSSNSMEDMAAV